MRYTVTGRTICPICKEIRTYSSELGAESHEEALRRFQNSHCLCCRCSLFGISAPLTFDDSVEIKRERINDDTKSALVRRLIKKA
jgi:hypothetical protein